MTGWRSFMVDVRANAPADSGAISIAIKTSSMIFGRVTRNDHFAIRNEIFTLQDDELRFIRLEDEKGEAVQNYYAYTNGEVGFAPRAANVDEYVALLRSNHRSEVLSALVFLGGRHLQAGDDFMLEGAEDRKRVELFKQLTHNDGILALVTKLEHSEDPWI